MIWQLDLLILILVVVCAFGALFIKDLMGASIVFGAYSFLMCLIWTGMGAVDVAFTEAAVGAGVSTVFFVATIYNTARTIRYDKRDFGLKLLTAIVVIVVGGFLATAVSDFPDWGDPQSPANSYVAAYYLTHSMEQTNVPNVVTTTLADYRAFDTMFETAVVFVAALAIVSLLRRKRRKDEKEPAGIIGNSLVIQYATRYMVPFMQIFALYVVAHGHHSPGGGFQGGVILGASLILVSMAFDMKYMLKKLSEKWVWLLSAIGVLIFAGIGVLALILGGNFLDYSVLSAILPATDSVMARSHSMLFVEIGVAITVMAGMFSIYAHIASDGKLETGL